MLLIVIYIYMNLMYAEKSLWGLCCYISDLKKKFFYLITFCFLDIKQSKFVKDITRFSIFFENMLHILE